MENKCTKLCVPQEQQSLNNIFFCPVIVRGAPKEAFREISQRSEEPRTGGSVGWKRAVTREFNSGRTNTQGL